MAAKDAVCTVAMTLSKETKGTFVYASDDPEAVIPQLYIRKSGMPNGAEKNINVIVQVK